VTELASTTTSGARTVAITGSLLGIATVLAPAFVSLKANRVLDGVSRGALQALGPWGWTLLAAWLAALALSVIPMPRSVRGLAVGLVGGAAAVIAVWRLGVAATAYSTLNGGVARVSLGPSAWLMLLASYMVVYAASAWTPRGWSRMLISLAPLVATLALLMSGALSSLSIMREYANTADEFAAQMRLHLLYVLGATTGGILIGVPAGLLAANRRRSEPVVFGTLNVLNVLPALAFIGLLNPVLGWLSDRVPALAAIGVHGVGWAPVLIVLTAYACYPIARNTHAAIVTLDASVLDAASGVGMGRLRRLAEVELPLAAPVIVAGIRIALVQTTAGAIVAGLVGGGGLGTFVFLGASQTATDLVLVGTIPIVALGLTFDRIAFLSQRLLSRWSVTA
jgi:osmoprotectant transport system permease protein